MFEKDLVAGDGPILGKGAYGVTRLSKSSFTGEYYAVSTVIMQVIAPPLDRRLTLDRALPKRVPAGIGAITSRVVKRVVWYFLS